MSSGEPRPEGLDPENLGVNGNAFLQLQAPLGS